MVTSMLRQATSKSFDDDGYGRRSYRLSTDPKYVPSIDVPELRKRLADLKATSQTLDVRIQARNWQIEVEDPFA